MHPILDPGDVAHCRVEPGVKSAPGGDSVLADPQESKETEGQGCFQHQSVMFAERVSLE